MKKTMTMVAIEAVSNNKAIEVENIKGCVAFEMTTRQLNKAMKELGDAFVLVDNKNDKTLFAIVAKSNKKVLVVVRKVKEGSSNKEKQLVKKVRISTTMEKDAGKAAHVCKVEVDGADDGEKKVTELLANFNKLVKECDFLQEANIADIVKKEDGKVVSYVEFPKSKGHSKDGYALYKKYMTVAKKEVRTA